MPIQDGPERRRRKDSTAATIAAPGPATATATGAGTMAAEATATGAGTMAAETGTMAAEAATMTAEATSAAVPPTAAETTAALAAAAGVPDISWIADKETRRRVSMAAESDLEAFRYAHWRGTVTFHEVASSWFHMSDPNLPDKLRDEFKTIFPGLLDAFAEPRKGIITAYFCRHIRVAAALTDIGHAAGAPEGVPEATLKGPPPAGIEAMLQAGVESESNGHGDPRDRSPWRRARREGDRGGPVPFLRRLLPGGPRIFQPAAAASSAIHIEPTFGDPADWKAKEILFQCLHLHYKALEFLTPQPRKICLRMIFGVITTLLGTLDHRQLERDTGGAPAKPFGSDPGEVETLERELAQAQAYYAAAAQRQAQLDYLFGMAIFLALAFAGTAAIALLTGLIDEAATVSVLGGAAGAVVSVMNRMTSGSLKVRAEAGKKTIRALGFMRPVIGATFGAVVYLFLDGGIVEVLSPPDGGANLAFYASLGFLSGFSERFAQDVIAQAGRDSGPPKQVAPAGGG
jgi:hypothetical protein